MKNKLGPGNETLHRTLRNRLTENIFNGEYDQNNTLPTERDLAVEHGISRVTVRKTLEIMQAEGLLARVQGSGTRFNARTGGYPGNMEIIALVAPAHNPFFSSFIRSFEDASEKTDSLVIFKQARENETAGSGKFLLKLFQKGIRDYVIWPYGEPADLARLKRLRGLGANIVLFDRVVQAAADCVSIDNRDGVEQLYHHLKTKGCKSACFIGWDNTAITSNSERLEAFLRLTGKTGRVVSLPWKNEADIEVDIDTLVARLGGMTPKPDAFLCGNGVIGMALKRRLNKMTGRLPEVCTFDDLPGTEHLRLTAYAQPMERLAEKVYERLAFQNRKPDDWKPEVCYYKGKLIVRSES
jgi:DNA-binding LacI/PurR family transcriptional regulator